MNNEKKISIPEGWEFEGVDEERDITPNHEEDMGTTTERQTMKQTLQDILLDISWAHLSMRYFGRSRSWLHQKLNGRDSNGGKGDFTESERKQLKEALKDLSRRIDKAANLI